MVVGHDRFGNLLILTARHIATAPNLEVVFHDGTIVPILRRYVQPRTAMAWAGDVAVVVVRGVPLAATAWLAHADAAKGELLSIIGNPADLRFHTNFARAANVVRVRWLNETDERVIDDYQPARENEGRIFRSLEIECDGCAPGDSGAGVFDTSGQLVGVMYGARYAADDERFLLEALTGRYAGAVHSTSFVVPISEIRPLLDAARLDSGGGELQ